MIKKVLVLCAIILAFYSNISAQCNGCTMTINFNTSATLTLTSTDVVCITGGIFSGTISNFPAGAKICISNGAEFNPSSMPNASAGTIIINNGSSALFPTITTASGFKIENYGTVTFNGVLTFNGISTIDNYESGSLTITQNFILGITGSSITNKGTMSFSGTFTGNNSTNIYNYGYFNIASTFTNGSGFKNYGRITSIGNVIFNAGAGSLFHNYCTLITNGNITNLNTTNTLNNYGLIIADVAGTTISNGSNTPVRPAWFQTEGAHTIGVNYINYGTVTGRGDYYFTGTTTNAAGASFGNDNQIINFYDTGVPLGIMDLQNVLPHASVTRFSYVPPVRNDLVTSCNIAINKGPIAADDYYTTSQSVAITGNVFSNDIDPENNSLSLGANLVAFPTHYSTFHLYANGDFIYVPTTGYFGTDMFIYSVCDNGVPVKCDSASVSFTIYENPVPMPACDRPGSEPASSLGTVPNTYFPGTTSALAGATSISIGPHMAGDANQNIAVGDKLMVIQIQGADINNSNNDSYGDGMAGGYGNGMLYNAENIAGIYEFVTATNTISAATGGTLTIESPLVYRYINSDYGAQGQRRFQVIKVPQYNNLQLTADITVPGWNGATGGIFCISVANTLDLNGRTISAKGKGFRGGGGRMLNSAPNGAYSDYLTLASVGHNGSKGEGICGAPQYLNNGGVLLNLNVEGYPGGSYGQGAPGNAGGGGTDGSPNDNQMNTGGGGGANGGSGGKGGHAWNTAVPSGGEPGLMFMAANANRLVFGGGGGAASTNNGTGDDCGGCTGGPFDGFASSGAAGGGTVIIYADSVINSGTIDASGSDANSTILNDASGGGGAGGSVLLISNNSLSEVRVYANGGNGGNNFPGGTLGSFTTGAPHGPGGGGGGGIVYSTSPVNYASSVKGGVSGLTAGPVAYGATNGNNGKIKATVKKSELPSGILGCYNFVAANNDNNITTQNIPVSGNLLANDFDIDGNSIKFSGIYDPNTDSYINNGSITVPGTDKMGVTVSNAGTLSISNSGVYTFSPAASFAGDVNLSYKITDNHIYVATAYAKITIRVIQECDSANNVTPLNDNAVTYMNVPVSLNVLINDIDPQRDSLIFNGFIDPSNENRHFINGSVNISGEDRFGEKYPYAGRFAYGNNGAFTFTPASHFVGSVTINYEVCDNNPLQVCKRANLKISVEPLRSLTQNGYPYPGENAAFTFMDTPLNGYNLLRNAGDANAGDTIKIHTTPVTGTSNGTLTINSNGTFLYTPDAGYTGPDQFTYQVCDNAAISACTNGIVYLNVLKSKVEVFEHPVNQNICTSGTANFSVSATGTNLTYQWQVSTDNGVSWNNIANNGVYSNVTDSVLYINGATALMNGSQYSCNLTTDCNTLATNAAILTVGDPDITVMTHPGDNSICNNANALFIVSAIGPDLTYQWQESTNNGMSWNNISNGSIYSGVNNDSLNLTGCSEGMNGFLYRCYISSGCATAVSSNDASLLVGTTSIIISSQPADASECSGTNTKFNVSATGSGLTFQWQENSGSGWVNLLNSGMYNGVTTASLSIQGLSANMDSFLYRCSISSACVGSLYSDSAILQVKLTPFIENTSPGVRCGAGTEVLSANASAGIVNWYTTPVGGSPFATGDTIISPYITEDTYYYADATYNGCRTKIRTNVIARVIMGTPAIIIHPFSNTVCEGSYHTFNIIASANVTGFQWQESNNGGADWTNIIDNHLFSGSKTSSLTIMGASASLTGNQYRCLASSTCSPPAISNIAILTVNHPPIIIEEPVRSWVCAGSNASFSVTAIGGITGYQWQLSTNAGTSWTDITNNATYSGATNSILNITGATAGMHNYLYRCKVSGTCYPVTTSASAPLITNTNSITVNYPTSNTAVSACAAKPLVLSAIASGPGITYQWQRRNPPFADIADGGIYSGVTTNNLTISDVSSVNGSQYRCLVSSNCAGTQNTSTYTVSLNTLVPTVTGNPGNNEICEVENTSFSALATVPVGSVTYQWQTSTNGGTIWNNTLNTGVYNGANASILNITGALPGMTGNLYRCTIASTSNTVCPANTTEGSLTVNPLPAAPVSAQSDRNNFCTNDAGNISLAVTGGTGSTVRWFTGNCGGSLVGTGNPLIIPSPTITTTYYARWENSCGNSNCTSVTVNVLPLSIAPTLASSDRNNFCTNDAGDINLTASGGDGTILRWYSGSCGGTLVGSGNPLTIASPGFSVTYYAAWENSCGISACADITVSVDQMPDTAKAGNDQTGSLMCGMTSTGLLANIPGYGSGSWSVVSGGGGSVATPSSATSEFTGAPDIPYILRWTITNGTCSSSDEVDISFHTLPLPDIQSSDNDNIFCEGSGVIFTAAGGTNYNFRINGNSAQDSTLNTYTTTTLTDGQKVDVIVTNAAGCNATSAGITNTVISLPAAPSASSTQSFVDNATINDLAALVNPGSSLYWFSSGAGGTALNAATALTDNTTYYAEAQNDITGCPSAARTVVTVNIYPRVTLEVDNITITETGGSTIVTARLSRISSKTVTIDLTNTGTAIAGTDYNTSGASIVITPGLLSGTVTITAVNDLLDENDETVIVDISSVTNGSENGTQQITTTIQDDDAAPPVSLNINNFTIAENAGTAIITATLNTVSELPVTVNLGYTGTAGITDFNASEVSIVIPAGILSGTVNITSVNDALDENDETVIADIISVINAAEITQQQVTATITDDDDAPSVNLSIDKNSLAENLDVAVVRATLSAISAKDVTVNLGFSGTATGGGVDYSPSNASILIPAGSLTDTITLTVVQDLISEDDETIITDILSVDNGIENGTQQVTATIVDDEGMPTVTLSINNPTIAENSGTALITATLNAVSALDVTITLNFTGTATGSTDHNISGNIITIPAGLLAGSITVTAIQDIIFEGDETIIADITSVTNAAESGEQTVTTTILDDEGLPKIVLSLDSASIHEVGGVATITANLDAISLSDVTIDLGVSGTAISGTDFNPSALSITIPAGFTTGTITITALPDLINENDETVKVDILSATNAAEDGIQQVITTITDDNISPAVTLTADQSAISENSGIAVITATLNTISGKDVTVYTGFSGTATNTADYSISASAITIPAGLLSGFVTLTAIQDIIPEGNETFVASIDSVINVVESGIQQVTVTITDDEVINQIPIAISDTVIVSEDNPVIVNVLGNDTGLGDGNIAVSIPVNGKYGSVIINGDNTITYTPLPDYYGSDSLIYQVCDINNDCDTAYIFISINSVNDIPLVNKDIAYTTEDNAVSVDVLNNDSGLGDGGITTSIVSGTKNGTAIFNSNNTITYTPALNYFGIDTLIYQLCDMDGECDTAQVVIIVAENNNIPVVVNNNKYVTTPQDTPVTVCMNVSDTDNENVTATWFIIHGTITKNDTTFCFTYTPNSGFTGYDTLALTFCDTRGACVKDTVWIHVTPVGIKPQATQDTIYLTTTIGKEVQGCITMVGSTNGLTTSVLIPPVNGNATISNQLCVNYTPNSGFTETDILTVTVCSQQGLCDTVVFVIKVLPVLIPDGFSPNGDGRNDYFVIQGLESFDKVAVKIFNRWGNKVFESNSYKNDWDGSSKNAFTLGGSKLPAGTYFYIIDFNNGKKAQAGSVYLSH